MIEQSRIPLDAPRKWNEALKGLKYTFGHTWGNCYAMHLTTGFETFLYVYKEGDRCMLCPIIEREFNGHIDIAKPFGFSGFVGNFIDRGFENRWRAFVKRRNYVCGYLGLNPIFDFSNCFDPRNVYEYNTVYGLDLTPSLDAIFNRLSTNRNGN